jgi:hypothetical protein
MTASPLVRRSQPRRALASLATLSPEGISRTSGSAESRPASTTTLTVVNINLGYLGEACKRVEAPLETTFARLHSEDDMADPKEPRSRVVLWAAVAIIGLYASFVVVLGLTGLLDFPEAGDGQAFAAVLGLLGGLFAASLTFVGVLIKHSIDDRNAKLAEQAERRLEIEAERNHQLAIDSERRARLDSSIRAVDMLSTPNGDPASSTEQAGALFALAHLGQLDLAITLLDEIWSAGSVSPQAATTLIDKALRDEDGAVQRAAAATFRSHAARLPLEDGDVEIPASIDLAWPANISFDSRQDLLDGLLVQLASYPHRDWLPEVVNGRLITLEMVRRQDPSPALAAEATFAVQVLLDAGDYEAGSYLYLPDHLVPAFGSQMLLTDVLKDDIAQAEPAARERLLSLAAAAVAGLRTGWGLTSGSGAPEAASTAQPPESESR